MVAVIGGSSAVIFVRMATAPSMVLVVYRMFMAAILLLPSAVSHREEVLHADRKTKLVAAAAGAVLGLHFFTYFSSVKMTSVAASSILVNLQVIFVAFLSGIIFKTRIRGLGWIAIFTALTGASIITLGSGNDGTGTLSGNMVALLSAVFLGSYFLLSTVCRRHLSTPSFTSITYPVSGLTMLIVALATGTPLFGYGAVNYLMGLCLAVFPTLMGHSLYSYCLKYLPTPTVSTMQLMDAVFAVIWGLLFFDDRLTWVVVIGGILAIGGVIWFNLLQSKSSAAEENAFAGDREYHKEEKT